MIVDNASTRLWVMPEFNGDIRLRSGETQKFLVDVHSSQKQVSELHPALEIRHSIGF
jgi:hypothetical protein